MNAIDTAIEQYNKKISFFSRKKKIVKKEGDYLLGEIKDTKEPFILNNSKLNGHACVIGNQERINELYLNYILQKIENNEPFIFINNAYLNFSQKIELIKQHAKKYNYSYDIKIDDYVDLLDRESKLEEKSHVFNLINYNELKEKKTSDILDIQEYMLLNYDINIFIIADAYLFLLKTIRNHLSFELGIPVNNSMSQVINTPSKKKKCLMSVIIGEYIPEINNFSVVFAQARALGVNFISSIKPFSNINDDLKSMIANTQTKILFTEHCSNSVADYISEIFHIGYKKIQESNFFYENAENLIQIK